MRNASKESNASSRAEAEGESKKACMVSSDEGGDSDEAIARQLQEDEKHCK